nr:hypothetical protein [uncultured Methanoregula sp.]
MKKCETGRADTKNILRFSDVKMPELAFWTGTLFSPQTPQGTLAIACLRIGTGFRIRQPGAIKSLDRQVGIILPYLPAGKGNDPGIPKKNNNPGTLSHNKRTE